MTGLSISEQLRYTQGSSDAAQANFAASILVSNQQTLAIGSAQSGVSGLLEAIRSAPNAYKGLIDLATQINAANTTSVKKLTEPTWTQTNAGTQASLSSSLVSLLGTYEQRRINPAASAAKAARDCFAVTDDGYKMGDKLLASLTALSDHSGSGDRNTYYAATLALATQTLADAKTLLDNLQKEKTPSDEAIAGANALISASEAAIAAATNPLTNETPTSYQLTSSQNPQAYLSTLGDSGCVTLTDVSGKGILITADGKVDSLPTGGMGWQFSSDSTFLLADGTKISITPAANGNSSASILVTRGEQQLSITNLREGSTPYVGRSTSGGVAADAARNDGYLFNTGGTLASWTLAGSALGDNASQRELVATQYFPNEVEIDVTYIDVTDTAFNPSLASQLSALGLKLSDFTDSSHPGKINARQLASVMKELVTGMKLAQSQFNNSLATTSSAVEALLKLNEFLAKILSSADKKNEEHAQVTAAERDQLRQLQQELTSATQNLRNTQARQSSSENILADALNVLSEISSFAPPPVSAPETQSDGFPPEPQAPQNSQPPRHSGDQNGGTVVQSLRRAERLLSGLSGGNASLRFAPTTALPSGTPDQTWSDTSSPGSPDHTWSGALPPDSPAPAESGVLASEGNPPRPQAGALSSPASTVPTATDATPSVSPSPIPAFSTAFTATQAAGLEALLAQNSQPGFTPSETELKTLGRQIADLAQQIVASLPGASALPAETLQALASTLGQQLAAALPQLAASPAAIAPSATPAQAPTSPSPALGSPDHTWSGALDTSAPSIPNGQAPQSAAQADTLPSAGGPDHTWSGVLDTPAPSIPNGEPPQSAAQTAALPAAATPPGTRALPTPPAPTPAQAPTSPAPFAGGPDHTGSGALSTPAPSITNREAPQSTAPAAALPAAATPPGTRAWPTPPAPTPAPASSNTLPTPASAPSPLTQPVLAAARQIVAALPVTAPVTTPSAPAPATPFQPAAKTPAPAPAPTASHPAPASAVAPLTHQIASALQALVARAPATQASLSTAPAPVSTGGTPQTAPSVPVFGTPEAFDRDATRLVDQFRHTYNEQLGQARQLQTQVRDVVEQFIVLVAKDDDLRQVFHADDLSDDQKAVFQDKIVTIERETGLTWGSDADLTPLGKANLNLRRFTSGMML